MANMNEKKKKQAEEVWRTIGNNEKLKGLMQLHEKIKEVENSRSNNRDCMDETNENYQKLKKNIKDFIRTQNVDRKKR